MSIVDIDKSWSSLLRPSWIAALDETPFLTRCRTGKATRAELLHFVLQHHYYSREFTRYLSALLATLADEDDRRSLVHNLFEEMGLDKPGGIPHARLYREMMASMGLDPRAGTPLPETEQLVRTMLDASSRGTMVGLGALCLGAEAIVPHLYSTVLAGFRATGDEGPTLEFFRLHVAEDESHALAMKQIIDRELERNPDSRIELEYGAARAIAARVRFLRALATRHVSPEKASLRGEAR